MHEPVSHPNISIFDAWSPILPVPPEGAGGSSGGAGGSSGGGSSVGGSSGFLVMAGWFGKTG